MSALRLISIILIFVHKCTASKNNSAVLRFGILPNNATMLKGSWVDGAPSIIHPLAEENIFILGLANIEEQILKMVKIRVTGETTFDWLEARYKTDYPKQCEKQSTFNEGCFQGPNVGQDKYDVDLVATMIESEANVPRRMPLEAISGKSLKLLDLLGEKKQDDQEDKRFRSLGCWGEAESDRAITEDYGKLDKQGCYEKTLSLGYRVFAINEGSNCYTSESAFKTYKKYGPISCDDPRSSIVYQINPELANGAYIATTEIDATNDKDSGYDIDTHSIALAGFAIYILLVLINLAHSVKRNYSRNLTEKVAVSHAKVVYKAFCFILAGYMGLTQVLRLLDNKDSSSIQYKTFNESPQDVYPTFSVCFFSTDRFSLHYVMRKEIEENTGLSYSDYDRLLKGETVENESSSKILAMKYDLFSVKLDLFLNAVGLETQNGEENMEAKSFYSSYQDPDKACFTLKSTNEIGVFRERDWISLNLDKLNEANVIMHTYIHYPGRLTREVGKPNFEIHPDEVDDDHTKTTLQLNRLSILRKRPDANEPCDPNLENDDQAFRIHVVKKVGCVPLYWENSFSKNDSFRPCMSPSELKRVYEEIKEKDKNFAEYGQPCNYMEVALGASQHTSSYDNVVILELQYMKKQFQEIVNAKDFEFESFWSSVGGFVGIILGYAFLDAPDFIQRMLQSTVHPFPGKGSSK